MPIQYDPFLFFNSTFVQIRLAAGDTTRKELVKSLKEIVDISQKLKDAED